MGLSGVQVGLIISWSILSSFSTAVVCLRLYDRRYIHKVCLALDDYAVLFSLICAICTFILTLLWTTCYHLGASMILSKPQAYDYQVLYYVSRIFYAFAFDVAKIAIMLFYIKVTNRLTQKSYWYFLIACLGFLIFDTVFHLLVLMVPCSPVSEFWNVGYASKHCWSSNTSATVINVFTFISEVVILLAPIPMLWLAGLTVKQRIALGVMFSLAALIILASALKLRNIIEAPGLYPSHDLGTAWIWVAVELNVALLVAGFLPLKALLEGTYFAVKRRFSSPDTSVVDEKQGPRHASITPSDPYDLNVVASLRMYPESPQSATMTLCNQNGNLCPKDTGGIRPVEGV